MTQAGSRTWFAGRSKRLCHWAFVLANVDPPHLPRDIAKVVIAVSLDGSGAPALAHVAGLRVAVTPTPTPSLTSRSPASPPKPRPSQSRSTTATPTGKSVPSAKAGPTA